MSTTADPDAPDPSRYTGRDRYLRVAEDFLGVTPTEQQERILRAVADHKRVQVQSANGVGKSFVTAVLNGAWLLRHPDSVAIPTSGSYGVLEDVLWKPLRRLWSRQDLPGRTLQSPPRIELGEEWYMRATSPRHPGNLEGRHAEHTLVTIEEADKPDISREHLDSAESLLTGGTDRLVVINNPPEDETNVVADLAESERWHTIQFSSLDSHNVRVDAGELDTDRLPGLVTLETVRENWEAWNGEPWPGLDEARTAHDRRTDLDVRWYRRRAGVIPPDTAAVARPYEATTAKQAYTDPAATNYFGAAGESRPLGTGIDVAGPGSDRTVAVTYYRNGDLAIRYTTTDASYPEQETALLADDRLGGDRYHPVAVDAAGEGSGLTDYLDDRLPDVYRFGSDKKPLTEGTADDTPYGLVNYATQRAEGLAALGAALPDARYTDGDLREELVLGGRTIEYGTKTLASRGPDGAEVVTVNSKSAVEERLGRSPDYLDAAMQAVWAAECADDGGVDPATAFAMEL
jgi:hypothetical protein